MVVVEGWGTTSFDRAFGGAFLGSGLGLGLSGVRFGCVVLLFHKESV